MSIWDSLKKIGDGMDVNIGVRTFIGKRAGRGIGEFLDGVGKEAILLCMENGEWLTDLLPPEMKASLIQQVMQYHDAFDAFPDEEVYSWVPEDKRIFFEGIEGGREYLLGQIAEIRRILESHKPVQSKVHRISA